MKTLIRPMLVLSASIFSFFLIVVLLTLFADMTDSAASVIAVPIVLIFGSYMWKSLKGRKMGAIATVFTGALLVGGISFAAGFFGPMIFAPGANQGPLLGILITGPLGLVVGALGGFIFWLRGNNNKD